MTMLPLRNSFGAPIYHLIETGSTMDEARSIAAENRAAPHGTAVVADRQSAGRGRVQGRAWQSEAAEGLLCTVILRFRSIAELPEALTLRIGLAVCRAAEALLPSLSGRVRIKWPNDLLIDGRKVCGILCEGDGRIVCAGIGVNVTQRSFPVALRDRAVSLATAAGQGAGKPEPAPDRYALLESILDHLAEDLAGSGAVGTAGAAAWRPEIEERLYRRTERVRFIDGAADSGRAVEGILSGLGPGGELLIRVDGEAEPRPFVTGELDVYGSGRKER